MNFYDVKVDGKKLIFADGNTVELPEAPNVLRDTQKLSWESRGEDIV